MNIAQIEENLQSLIKSYTKEGFIYDLLLAYGSPKASISRLQNGNLNLSKVDGEVSWKKKVFFKPVENGELHGEITELVKQLKHEQRFVVVTDFVTLLAIDTKTLDKLDVELGDLPKHFDFFLPWAGMEKAQHANENPADVKAAGKMAKLFDEIKKDNPDATTSPADIHALNVFLSRLLFCFFAEDTNIFNLGQFTNAIDSHTQADGSDLHTYLDNLFNVLNTPEKERKHLPAYLQAFPYVNGGLFAKAIPSPKFSRRSRQAIVDSGELQWKEINPDIFGSMFQAVVSVDQRGNLGQHYTSVPNIMKVIEPLFLNELYEAFENAKVASSLTEKAKKLNDLHVRISKIKIFDPACGSGNFLIIAYKELRKLEMKILKELGVLAFSAISLNNFHGIEIDDFAHEIAQLSLWLAEHQMNVEFYKQFGRTLPTLPLREAGHIVHGNACRLNWDEVCPKQPGDEIYVLGNPPYLGARMQDSNQKSDMDLVFQSFKNYRDLDYIACWFYKGAQFIKDINAQMAYVSTNSICQGLQVGLLWPSILKLGVEIQFAHLSFKSTNNAKGNAGVTVAIIGLANKNKKQKLIYVDGIERKVNNINAYLIDADNILIDSHSNPLSFKYHVFKGNQATDGGGLIFNEKEKEEFLKDNNHCSRLIKNLVGSQELIKGIKRYCLWITPDDYESLKTDPKIAQRLDTVKANRLLSPDAGTRELSNMPYRFRDCHITTTSSIVIPGVSSENRIYIPIGFFGPDTIITNSAFVVYDSPAWLFSVLTSKLHMIWLDSVGGKLKFDYRYSKDLVYNTFPFPPITEKQKDELTLCTFRILEEREKHSEKTLAQLYDPDKMPDGLREAHRLNDLAVERCYRSKLFESDEERLEYLFKMYEGMVKG